MNIFKHGHLCSRCPWGKQFCTRKFVLSRIKWFKDKLNKRQKNNAEDVKDIKTNNIELH